MFTFAVNCDKITVQQKPKPRGKRMKVKKLFCGILSALLLLTFLVSCKGEKKLTVTEISQELAEICLTDEEIYEVSKADIENRFNFDGNLLNEYSVKISNNEEKFVLVAVMQLKDKKDRQVVIDGVNASVKAASASFSVLGDAQLSKIQQRLLYEYNDILIVVVADKYDAVREYLEKIGAKQTL
ncbi:MAG: DUF4358 domain-containing protein [Ruminococcaceae bacterium]|nr:DUF4358 domain-containing protein [Oscillospiraceae bacterium]